MSDTERTHGVCGNCKERFPLTDEHVSYGGLLWCSEHCLAEFVVEKDMDVTKVATGLEHRPVERETDQ